MNTMTYKGYVARIEYDDDDKILVGQITGIRDMVTFHAESVEKLEKEFRKSVDSYLAACAKLGQAPNKPSSGKLTLRMPPEIHARAAMMAEASGKSLNTWAVEVIAQNACSTPY